MERKNCKKCNAPKPLTEFYAHPSTADRRSSSCKDCIGEEVKKRRQKLKEENPEALREYNAKKGREFRERKRQEYFADKQRKKDEYTDYLKQNKDET